MHSSCRNLLTWCARCSKETSKHAKADAEYNGRRRTWGTFAVSIRVAYDISFLGRFFDRTDERSGVFRVIEELLTALSERQEVDLTALALCGEDHLWIP